MRIWMREEGDKTALLLVVIHKPIEIHIEDSISVQEEKVILDQPPGSIGVWGFQTSVPTLSGQETA